MKLLLENFFRFDRTAPGISAQRETWAIDSLLGLSHPVPDILAIAMYSRVTHNHAYSVHLNDEREEYCKKHKHLSTQSNTVSLFFLSLSQFPVRCDN